MLRRSLGICCLFLCSLGGAFSAVRDIEGIDIVPRTQRGATASWGNLYGGAWESYLSSYNAYEAWLAGEGEDNGTFEAKKQANELERARVDFLEEYFPQDIVTSHTVSEVNGQKLAWPRSFSRYKKKIVVHHTAGDQVYDTPALALIGMQDIYKYHTLTRGRGDVGYNFIIDPYGTIYEGRAGGKGVVGAHTDRNNVSTIGIALMGNFDRDEPTNKAWNSLKQLTLLLALQYNIDPYARQSYFSVTHEDPYLQAHTDLSIVGHQDVKTTGCPGKHIDERLEGLRRQIADALTILQQQGIKASALSYIDHRPTVYMKDLHGKVAVPFPTGGKVSCKSLSDTLAVTDCTWGRDNMLELYLGHDGYPASGIQSVLVTVGNRLYQVSLSLVRDKDLDLLRQYRKQQYIHHHPFPSLSGSEKITTKIPSSLASSLMKKPVNVFLYEASTDLEDWEMSCEPDCRVVLDDTTIEDISNLRIIRIDDALRVFIGREKYDTTKLVVEDADFMFLDNYERSYGGVPMHIFRGTMTRESQKYKHLDHGRVDDWTLVNSVSFDEYMQGVGEISEQQHLEKIKAMTLLTKGYMLFYIDKSNVHPTIPAQATYNAIDDPRIFQRYFGAGFEIYGTQWLASLEGTKNQYISYDGYLPILPYFHCSAGFTKSGKEALGRTDTPWLTSVLDVAICASGVFEGHGVGLSGDGAEALAQAGMTYKDIIKWYYIGVDID